MSFVRQDEKTVDSEKHTESPVKKKFRTQCSVKKGTLTLFSVHL